MLLQRPIEELLPQINLIQKIITAFQIHFTAIFTIILSNIDAV